MEENRLIVVKQLPVIEDQLLSVKSSIEARVAEALSMACTESTYKSVKKVRAELRKEAEDLESRRKEVKEAIMAPYAKFESVYKDCAGTIYAEADKTLKKRISEVEAGIKSEKTEAVRRFYDEYKESVGLTVDWLPFESAGISVGMSDSKKALNIKAQLFIDHVMDDLAMISTQDDKDEILVEYQKSLNASAAVKIVADRHRAMEAEKARREAERSAREARERAKAEVMAAAAEEEANQLTMAPPVATPAEPEVPADHDAGADVAEKMYCVSFRVAGTLQMLKDMKKFLVDGGYRYEQI